VGTTGNIAVISAQPAGDFPLGRIRRLYGVDPAKQVLYAAYSDMKSAPLIGGYPSSYIDYDGAFAPSWFEPQDAVSKLARLAPPEPPMPWPVRSLTDMLRLLTLHPDGLKTIVIDSVSGVPDLQSVPMLSLRDRIAYYFQGNLDEVTDR
jgi:hypothetical protein